MSTIQFSVKGQEIYSYSNQLPLVADLSIGFVKVKFNFSSDWSDLEKVAQFIQGGTTYNQVLINDECIIPNEIQAGEFFISVFGTNSSGIRGTTTLIKVSMLKSGFTSSSQDPIPPTLDLYAQLLDNIHKAEQSVEENAEQVRKDREVVEEVSITPPNIGINGNWYVFVDGTYTDSGVPATGPQGEQGPQGPAGSDGHTPVKGTDYWTQADRQQMVQETMDALEAQGGLNGKTVLIVGDSINYGAGWEGSGGFAQLIQETYPNCTVINKSAGGTTLANDIIFYQLYNYYQSGGQADVILIDGGGNDLIKGLEQGVYSLNSMSYNYGDFDNTTTFGALDKMLGQTQAILYPQARLFFFGLFKMGTSQTEGPMSYEGQAQFWEDVKAICGKWNVPYVDFFHEGGLSVPINGGIYTMDGLHPNEAGYRRLWPCLNRALRQTAGGN